MTSTLDIHARGIMRFVLALLMFAMAYRVSAAEPDSTALNGQVDVIVKNLIGEDKYAYEYRDARRLHVMDIDRDRIEDAIVFFTIEGYGGGNNYHFYMSVLKGTPSGFVPVDTVVIGGQTIGHPSFDRPTVKMGRVIIIDRLEYNWDTDAVCCPSKKSKAAFILHGSTLEELKKVE